MTTDDEGGVLPWMAAAKAAAEAVADAARATDAEAWTAYRIAAEAAETARASARAAGKTWTSLWALAEAAEAAGTDQAKAARGDEVRAWDQLKSAEADAACAAEVAEAAARASRLAAAEAKWYDEAYYEVCLDCRRRFQCQGYAWHEALIMDPPDGCSCVHADCCGDPPGVRRGECPSCGYDPVCLDCGRELPYHGV